MSSTDLIRVVIADDQTLVREAVAGLLELEPDLTVVAQASNGDEAAAAVAEHRPNVCVMDIQMPGVDGLEATAIIRRSTPETRVLIVTTFSRPGYLRQALDRGASGFLVKDAPIEQLISAIRRVAEGLRVVDPVLAAESLFDGENPLSEREQEVLRLAADGRNAASIAAAVYLSPGTVRNHLSSAIGKTGATNRAGAVRIAQDKGWL